MKNILGITFFVNTCLIELKLLNLRLRNTQKCIQLFHTVEVYLQNKKKPSATFFRLPDEKPTTAEHENTVLVAPKLGSRNQKALRGTMAPTLGAGPDKPRQLYYIDFSIIQPGPGPNNASLFVLGHLYSF